MQVIMVSSRFWGRTKVAALRSNTVVPKNQASLAAQRFEETFKRLVKKCCMTKFVRRVCPALRVFSNGPGNVYFRTLEMQDQLLGNLLRILYYRGQVYNV